MGWRARALSTALRLLEKPRLARARDPLAVRAAFERQARLLFRDPPHALYLRAVLASRPDGSLLRGSWARVGPVRPRGAILHLHGGAFVMGSARTHRAMGAALSARTGLPVCLPDYRLAPEHPFPAALDDACAAYGAMLDLGYLPGRIALGGDSAGGGLAFALLGEIAARGWPFPGAVYALSPWLDMTGSLPSVRDNVARDALLPATQMARVREWYLAGHDPCDPRASPLFGRHQGLPPALLLVGEEEILRDESVEMAARLRAGGGTARADVVAGVPHVWPIFQGLLPEADAALDHLAAHLCGALDGDADPLPRHG
ncbi:MAG: alpha/beta hydrolase [Rhodobacteraceae bacterium]|nr:alpha/beta hydrolase [Paracoccaceae bacterium]